jgi:hypothetical protein
MNKNIKSILCYKIIKNNCCNYHNCMFAHNLEEQHKNNIRECIYEIINKNDDLSNINLIDNTQIFDELVIHTKLCKKCAINICTGGYNCIYGSCVEEMKICINDLLYGKCNEKTETFNNKYNIKITKCCNGIHLTDRKLIPYYQQNIKKTYFLFYNKNNTDDIKYYYKINITSITLNDDTIENLQDYIK